MTKPERMITRAGAIEPGDGIAPRGEWLDVSAVEVEGDVITVRTLQEETVTYHRGEEVQLWRRLRR